MSGSAPAARPADGSFTPSELAQYRTFGYCVVRQLLTPDETARIVVYDEGEGMDEELLEVAGEQPMSSRQGLGVGLFVGRAVLERLGGTMEIESAPGRGTRVTLRLPLVEPEAS